jgi:hypothetical protein
VIGSDGRVYVGGYTGSEFPVTNDAYLAAYQGGYTDGFLAVITQ